MITSKKIILRLKSLTGMTQKDIALKIFKISDNNLSQKIKRDSIDFIELIRWAIHKSMDLNYLMGGKGLDKNKNISDLLESARRVLNSGHPMAVEALERNIKYFAHAIEIEDRLSVAETSIKEMRKEFDNLKNEWVMKRASVGGATKRKAM